MANVAPHAFRFPYDKYEDEVALYANFRYLQEFLRRLSANGIEGNEVVVKPHDSISDSGAHIYLTGNYDLDSAVLLEASQTHGNFRFLDGTVNANFHENDLGNRVGDMHFQGSGIGKTIWKVRTLLPFIPVEDTQTVVRDITFDGVLNEGSIAIAQREMHNMWIETCEFIGYYSSHAIGDGNNWYNFTPGFMMIRDCLFHDFTDGTAGSDEPIQAPTSSFIIGNHFEGEFKEAPNGVIAFAERCIIIGNTFLNCSNSGNNIYPVSTNDSTAGDGDFGSRNIIALNVFQGCDNDDVDLSAGAGDIVFGNIPTTSTTQIGTILDDLNDVTITTVTDNEVLSWDDASSLWINQTLAELGLINQTDEEIQDIVGAMVSGNTETGIAVTYQDADGTIDFVLDSEITDFFAATDITGAEAEELTDGSQTALHTHAGGGGGSMDDWLLAGDAGTPQTISDGNTATFTGGTGIDTTASATDVLTIDLDSATQASLALADSATQPGDNVSTLTNDAGYITATLTQEEVEDFVGAMVSGNTETLITVTYQDADGTIDFVVTDTLSSYTNDAGFITATLTQEQVEDFVGAMVTGNTETLITVTYQDADGTIDFVVDADLGNYTNTPGWIANVVEDTTPQLGGSLDVNGNKIVSTANGNIDIEPNGTGNVLLGNFVFNADQTVGAGQDDYVLTYDNATGLINLEAAPGAGGGISNVVEDTTPQLGGDLDTNAHDILVADDDAIYFGTDSDATIVYTNAGDDFYVTGGVTAMYVGNSSGTLQLQGVGDINIINDVHLPDDTFLNFGADDDGFIYYNSTGDELTMSATTSNIQITNSGDITLTSSAGDILVDLASGGELNLSTDTAVTKGANAAYLFGGEVIFTSSGAFTKASYPGLRAIRVHVQGAGGGGGNAAANPSMGSGGGGGGYARSWVLATDLDTSEAVTIGAAGTGGSTGVAATAGGDSIFDTISGEVRGVGGSAGAQDGGSFTSGGGGTGDFVIPGGQGGRGSVSVNLGLFGGGGDSFYGHGVGQSQGGSSGQDGTGYGSGGSGGHASNATDRSGGNGRIGIVVVELFY